MTEQEAQALMQLLARMPMTAAEALWVRALIERLTQRRSSDPANAPEAR